MAYSKLHSSLVNSSLWTEADNVRLLFITLLALCDREGYVYGSRPGLERLANIEATKDADVDPWHVLMSPDPHSSDRMRNPENEGRRIEEVAGGFRLLNFPYYRGLRNEDDRREQNRAAQSRFKAKAKVSHDKPHSAADKPISDTDTDTDTEYKKNKHKGAQSDLEAYCESIGLPKSDGTACFAKWEGNGWTNGGAKIKDWKATCRSWKLQSFMPSQRPNPPSAARSNGTKPRAMSFEERKKRIGAVRQQRNDLFRLKEEEHRDFTQEENEEYRLLTEQLNQLEAL